MDRQPQYIGIAPAEKNVRRDTADGWYPGLSLEMSGPIKSPAVFQ
jgi:hypothetical protein